MELDHLCYVAGQEGLGACVQRLGAKLGAGFLDGGIHPRVGTRNYVLPLSNGCYLEVVEALDHPAVEEAPFGRAVKRRTEAGGGWLGWIVRVEDIGEIEARLGRPAVDGHRVRPDGVDLRWKQVGVNDMAANPHFPFFVQWLTDSSEHPSAGPTTVTLKGLEVSGDVGAINDYLGTAPSEILSGLDVVWRSVDDDDNGIMSAEFETSHGMVHID